ncbi:trigger factor [Candidatus Margulisiibacteriota bacterium]
MKIRTNNREGNTVVLEIEEEHAKLAGAIEKTLVEAGREIKIPGFRPGKAPKDLIEKAVDRQVLEARAAEKLISDLYPQIIDETKIEPVDYPKVEIIEQKKKKPFVFKISVDVYPDVKLGKYKGLKVEKKAVEVTEEDVVKVFSNLQQRLTKTSPDGKKEELPLDDEFAKKVSRFGTLAELKEEVRNSMLKDRTASAEAEMNNKLIAEASAEAKVEIPAGMINREVNIMLDELRASLSQSNLTLEDYLKGIKKEEGALKEELNKSAEIRVRGKVVLRTVAEAEKMKISAEEMETELKAIAASSGDELATLKQRMDESFKEYIEDYMLRRKALEFIAEKAKIGEVKEEAK